MFFWAGKSACGTTRKSQDLKRVVMAPFGLIFGSSDAESFQDAYGTPPDPKNPHRESKNPENPRKSKKIQNPGNPVYKYIRIYIYI